MSESSTKPYIIRALHEWCLDNGYTPYIVVTVDENTVVPPAHIANGQITLNTSPMATNQLVMGNDYIEFESRFSGQVEQLFIPVAAISAIYAKETGAGMGFEVIASKPYPGIDNGYNASTEHQSPSDNNSSVDSSSDKSESKVSHLKIVK